MSWVVDGKTFARKVKNPAHGMRTGGSIVNPMECPSCGYEFNMNEVMPEWPGLPAGVKFDPSDQELLEHLGAQVGLDGTNKTHPFINEFIPTLDTEDGICYTHPEKLPGIRRDGSSIHFFHRPTRAYTTGTRKRRKVQSNDDEGEVRWHKTGKTRPVIDNGKQVGCKKIMVLYVSFGKKSKLDKTNWVMHQYHLGVQEEEREGEFVVSKLFYQTQPRQTVAATGNDNVDESEHVTSLELIGDPSNDSSGMSSMPVTPLPQPVSQHKGLLEAISKDVHHLQASLSLEQKVGISPQELASESDILGEATLEVQVNGEVKPAMQTADSRGLLQEEHLPANVPDGGSQPFSGSFDADLLKLLCNENLKTLSQGDSSGGDWKSVAAEVCSSQDISLDKIVLNTPPDLLEFLFNSQGSSLDWSEKLKMWSDSQKLEDFNLNEFLQNSQSLQ